MMGQKSAVTALCLYYIPENKHKNKQKACTHIVREIGLFAT